MTHGEVMAMVAEMGLPSSYHHFAEGESPEPPFIVFLYPEADNFAADGIVYFKMNRLHIELYTDLKQPDLEESIEAVLLKHGIFYSKSETWMETERMYEVFYGMEV